MFKPNACPGCGGDVVGRRDKKWCTERCRAAARDKSDYNARYRAANKERLAESNRQWASRNRETVNAQRRRWVARNADAVRAYHREYNTEWYARNRDRQVEYQSRRRALKRANGVYQVPPRDYWRMLCRTRGMCVYCQSARATEWDHVVPISRGGSHGIGNLAPACGTCNRSKGALLLSEWNARRSLTVL